MQVTRVSNMQGKVVVFETGKVRVSIHVVDR